MTRVLPLLYYEWRGHWGTTIQLLCQARGHRYTASTISGKDNFSWCIRDRANSTSVYVLACRRRYDNSVSSKILHVSTILLNLLSVTSFDHNFILIYGYLYIANVNFFTLDSIYVSKLNNTSCGSNLKYHPWALQFTQAEASNNL